MEEMNDIWFFFKIQQTAKMSLDSAWNGKSADSSPAQSTSRSQHLSSSENMNKQIP